jgi:hypothetical protein
MGPHFHTKGNAEGYHFSIIPSEARKPYRYENESVLNKQRTATIEIASHKATADLRG